MQTEEETLHTLAHLRDAWGVDISEAEGLQGADLMNWMQRIRSELIEREYEKVETARERVCKIINDPVHRNKKWLIRWP